MSSLNQPDHQEQLRTAEQTKCGLNQNSSQDLSDCRDSRLVINSLVANNASLSEGINFFTELREGSIRISVDNKGNLLYQKYVGGSWKLLQRFS